MTGVLIAFLGIVLVAIGVIVCATSVVGFQQRETTRAVIALVVGIVIASGGGVLLS